MYHPFVEAIALIVADLPTTFTIILLYCVVLYFLIGLQRTPGQFLCVDPCPFAPPHSFFMTAYFSCSSS